MRQALAISVALLAALLQGGQLASAQNDTLQTLQYTEKFLSSKIGYNMMHISENMKAAMSGALKHMPPQSAQQVRQIRSGRPDVDLNLFYRTDDVGALLRTGASGVLEGSPGSCNKVCLRRAQGVLWQLQQSLHEIASAQKGDPTC